MSEPRKEENSQKQESDQLDQSTQAELEERYLEQQRRIACEGCGEGGEVF